MNKEQGATPLPEMQINFEEERYNARRERLLDEQKLREMGEQRGLLELQDHIVTTLEKRDSEDNRVELNNIIAMLERNFNITVPRIHNEETDRDEIMYNPLLLELQKRSVLLETGEKKIDETLFATTRIEGRPDGKQRKTQNEDAVLYHENFHGIFDGMGGHESGEIASMLACDTVRQVLEEELPENGEITENGIRAILKKAFEEANARIQENAKLFPERKGMGTTATVGVRFKDIADGTWKMAIAHVGDSQALLLRGEKMTPLTTPMEIALHPLFVLKTEERRLKALQEPSQGEQKKLARIQDEIASLERHIESLEDLAASTKEKDASSAREKQRIQEAQTFITHRHKKGIFSALGAGQPDPSANAAFEEGKNFETTVLELEKEDTILFRSDGGSDNCSPERTKGILSLPADAETLAQKLEQESYNNSQKGNKNYFPSKPDDISHLVYVENGRRDEQQKKRERQKHRNDVKTILPTASREIQDKIRPNLSIYYSTKRLLTKEGDPIVRAAYKNLLQETKVQIETNSASPEYQTLLLSNLETLLTKPPKKEENQKREETLKHIQTFLTPNLREELLLRSPTDILPFIARQQNLLEQEILLKKGISSENLLSLRTKKKKAPRKIQKDVLSVFQDLARIEKENAAPGEEKKQTETSRLPSREREYGQASSMPQTTSTEEMPMPSTQRGPWGKIKSWFRKEKTINVQNQERPQSLELINPLLEAAEGLETKNLKEIRAYLQENNVVMPETRKREDLLRYLRSENALAGELLHLPKVTFEAIFSVLDNAFHKNLSREKKQAFAYRLQHLIEQQNPAFYALLSKISLEAMITNEKR